MDDVNLNNSMRPVFLNKGEHIICEKDDVVSIGWAIQNATSIKVLCKSSIGDNTIYEGSGISGIIDLEIEEDTVIGIEASNSSWKIVDDYKYVHVINRWFPFKPLYQDLLNLAPLECDKRNLNGTFGLLTWCFLLSFFYITNSVMGYYELSNFRSTIGYLHITSFGISLVLFVLMLREIRNQWLYFAYLGAVTITSVLYIFSGISNHGRFSIILASVSILMFVSQLYVTSFGVLKTNIEKFRLWRK